MSGVQLPRILAIETATEACSAALLCGDEVISRCQIAPRDHGQLILQMVDDLLAEAGLAVTQLDALALGRGPGAFTGVRIATGVVQGIAFAADLPVARVSTLMALAHGGWRETGRCQVLAAMDARIGELYVAGYRFGGLGAVPACEIDECLCAPALAPRPAQGGWYAVGSGWQAYQAVLEPMFADLVEACEPARLPLAEDVARLGAAYFKAGDVVVAEQALPVYLRDQVAEKMSNR